MPDLSIPVLFINLDQSSDRLLFMRRQAERLGLEFERIPAVDALHVPVDLAGYFAHIQTGKLPIIDDAAVGCYASHLKALRRFEQTDAPAALIRIEITREIRFPPGVNPNLGHDVRLRYQCS